MTISARDHYNPSYIEYYQKRVNELSGLLPVNPPSNNNAKEILRFIQAIHKRCNLACDDHNFEYLKPVIHSSEEEWLSGIYNASRDQSRGILVGETLDEECLEFINKISPESLSYLLETESNPEIEKAYQTPLQWVLTHGSTNIILALLDKIKHHLLSGESKEMKGNDASILLANSLTRRSSSGVSTILLDALTGRQDRESLPAILDALFDSVNQKESPSLIANVIAHNSSFWKSILPAKYFDKLIHKANLIELKQILFSNPNEIDAVIRDPILLQQLKISPFDLASLPGNMFPDSGTFKGSRINSIRTMINEPAKSLEADPQKFIEFAREGIKSSFKNKISDWINFLEDASLAKSLSSDVKDQLLELRVKVYLLYFAEHYDLNHANKAIQLFYKIQDREELSAETNMQLADFFMRLSLVPANYFDNFKQGLICLSLAAKEIPEATFLLNTLIAKEDATVDFSDSQSVNEAYNEYINKLKAQSEALHQLGWNKLCDQMTRLPDIQVGSHEEKIVTQLYQLKAMAERAGMGSVNQKVAIDALQDYIDQNLEALNPKQAYLSGFISTNPHVSWLQGLSKSVQGIKAKMESLGESKEHNPIAPPR